MAREAWAGREAWTWQLLSVLFKKGLLNVAEIRWRGLNTGSRGWSCKVQVGLFQGSMLCVQTPLGAEAPCIL